MTRKIRTFFINKANAGGFSKVSCGLLGYADHELCAFRDKILAATFIDTDNK